MSVWPGWPAAAGLEGKICVVTGSTRGIGRTIAAALGGAGAVVVVTGRTEDAGRAVASQIESDGGRAMFVRCDVSEESNVAELFATVARELGRVDVVVNNAAATGLGVAQQPVVQHSSEQFDYFVRATLYSAFWCFKYAIPTMGTAGGVFVSISSNASSFPTPAHPAYAAAKAGLNGLVRQVALDYGPTGIRSNAVVIGFTDKANNPFAENPEAMSRLRAATLGVVPTYHDVAGFVLYLASDAGRAFNGALLHLDGGASVKLARPDYRDLSR